MNSSLVPASKLVREPYSLILGYPKATKGELAKRHAELKKLGISGILFEGPTMLGKIHVLGKGYVGVVVIAKLGKKYVALKIRRTDSSRPEMKSEARLLKIANKAGVGPKFVSTSRNFMVMEYIQGQKITDWVRDLKGKGSAAKLRSVIKNVLEDCHTLDTIHLDHGELSYIHKHVIVGKSPCIIDFESSSTNRRTSNVTAATQSIFIGSALSSIVKNIIKIPDKKKMIGPLKKYKHDQSRENFEDILDMLGLDKN
ncbi:putative serine/threonine protein kinase [Nitrosotalea sinensis]|uniref:non-specific serine/threonine protein kinase n=1 Tax=Nitrosotalea sinensis TaxID=1499975 RepID=A0A2H1EFP9_9ARCH|nr:RIO1 family regulatory kinase/ATPase [Candidatus Nitrosotalea sinensis]SHO43457.1 putative serine/threonine protein kinase [Candidatus Nitrosotalea sinensis]